jgi:E3 ubiquitin-protein ligase HUWE1
VTNIVPLKEGGAAIQVTNENKREYVQLSAEYRLVTSIREQIDALLGGFYEIIPKELISIVSSRLENFYNLMIPR